MADNNGVSEVTPAERIAELERVSDTPRTDAEGVRFARIMIEWDKPSDKQVTELIPADFARRLERALKVAEDELQRELTECKGVMAYGHGLTSTTVHGTCCSSIRAALAQIKELRDHV